MWQPGQPIQTAADKTAHQEWLKARKAADQRLRRAKHRRIDYYPSSVAADVIDRMAAGPAAGDYSSIINILIGAVVDPPE